jgi:thiol-disulfide isomerase/thioredoxin
VIVFQTLYMRAAFSIYASVAVEENTMRACGIRPAIALAMLLTLSLSQAADEPEVPDLLGRCTVEDLREKPFATWFDDGYESYVPSPEIVSALREAAPGRFELTVFFGTWCGDSRRELPRLVKILDAIEFPRERLRLVAVDRADDAVKRSPGGEERGLEVYRVPTVIVSRAGTEVARIVEHPRLSLERDLLAIARGEDYESSYASYPIVRGWRERGVLGDPNVSARGLAAEVRHVVASEGELAAAAGVLLSRGETRGAVKLFEVNCVLFPESARGFARLAEGLERIGETERAREAVERALRLADDPEEVTELVDLVERLRAPAVAPAP